MSIETKDKPSTNLYFKGLYPLSQYPFYRQKIFLSTVTSTCPTGSTSAPILFERTSSHESDIALPEKSEPMLTETSSEFSSIHRKPVTRSIGIQHTNTPENDWIVIIDDETDKQRLN